MSLCITLKHHSKSKTYVFDYGFFNGDTLNPVPCYRKSEPKLAAAQTENIGFGFGMVFLCIVQAEIDVFPVWAAAIFGSDFR